MAKKFLVIMNDDNLNSRGGSNMINNEKFDHTYGGVEGALQNTSKIKHAAKGVKAFRKAGDNLQKLNTMRGGEKGFKGFVGENMEAAEASACGRNTSVLNDNGIADLKHFKVNGSNSLKQMKIGYKPGEIDFSKYKGQTVVIDKGNPYFNQFKTQGAKQGVKVVEGHITAQEAKHLSDAMQWETKITGSKNSVIIPKVYEGVKTVSAAHKAGAAAAKSGAIAGAGFSIGSNIVDVMTGKKKVGEATKDIAEDTVKAGAVSYGTGVAGSLVASTEIGAAALETAGVIGTTIAEAPVIGSVIGAAGTAATAAGGLGTAAAAAASELAVSAVGAATTGASALAAGTAIAGTVSTVGAGVAAGTAAIGAAAVAAAPMVVPAVILGGVITGICSLFKD